MKTPTPTIAPPEIQAPPPIDSAQISREQLKLVARIEAIRKVQALGPMEAPAGMSDADLARRLMYDTLACLTRSELVLQQSSEALLAYTEELKRANDLAAEAAEHRRREYSLEDKREARRWNLLVSGEKAAMSALTNPKITATIIGGLLSLIVALLTAWGILPADTVVPKDAP